MYYYRSPRHNAECRASLLSWMVACVLLTTVGALPASAISIERAADTNSASGDAKSLVCALGSCFSSIAQRAEPGVVSITAVQRGSSHMPSDSGTSSQPPPNQARKRGCVRIASTLPAQRPRNDVPVVASGSGVIVRRVGSDFFILTNYHVVEGAYRVAVHLTDATTLKGIVTGVDPATDLAVVQVTSSKLSDSNVVPIGDSDSVEVGSWVLALGSPYGFEHTLTVGVVSALHREIEQDDDFYPDLIQTDAAINKGNSGGPLLNVDGRVIGINSVIASPTGGFIGLGFAIPINTAASILDQLIQQGRVIRGWLGAGVQELTPVLQEFYGVKAGVLVSSVDEKSPASRAGLLSEDIITSSGGTPVGSVRLFQQLVATTAPGTSLNLGVVRDGRSQIVTAVLGLSPLTPASRPTPPPGLIESIGVKVSTLSRDTAKSMGLKRAGGVIVVDVSPASPAENAGLQTGDVISSLNGLQIGDDTQFRSVLREIRPGGLVVLKIYRKGESRIIGFKWE